MRTAQLQSMFGRVGRAIADWWSFQMSVIERRLLPVEAMKGGCV
jgi:hypothetical protein